MSLQKILLVLLCFVSMAYAAESSIKVIAPAHDVDRIAAYVNKGVITSNQVSSQMDQVMKQFQQTQTQNLSEIRKQVLDQLVLQKIQLDMALRAGIKTSDLEVNDAINNIAKNQRVDLAGLKDKLALDGVAFDRFFNQVRDQITIDKLKQHDVDGRVVVSDDEVTQVLNSEAYKQRIDYNLSDIIIDIPEQSTADAVAKEQQIANGAYQELVSGVPFEQVALKYSTAPNALTGGVLGWKSSATLPPIILTRLQGLESGQFTTVVQIPVGFFIFKINDIRRRGAVQMVHQYHVRHILLKVNELMSDDEAHQKILQIKAQLNAYAKDKTKESEEFVRLAKQYSEDTSSVNGGDIGWVSVGDTVPAFEQAVTTLPVDTISSPIRTPFGWHLVEVLGTRESNLTTDKERAEIRQELRDNKANLLYTQWLRDIREMSYVKINDN